METHGRSGFQDESLGEHDSTLSQSAVLSRLSIQLPPSTIEPNEKRIPLSQSTMSSLTATEIEQATFNSLPGRFESPEIRKQPRRHYHVRMLTDVKSGRCPLVQAGERKSQRVYPETAVSSDGLKSSSQET